MTTCDPLRAEPKSDVFARGTAKDRGKTAVVGSVTNPGRIFLRIRSTAYGDFFVQWTMTCTNGKRNETTTDEGLTRLPLQIQLPIGIAGATRCSASASAVSAQARNYEVKGTLSVELLSKP
jgi:hypothetical protein